MLDSSRKPYVLSLGSLVLGILIGISIDVAIRPNHIQFWVNPVQKLSVRLQPGDKVEWLKQDGTPMGISFWGGSPCVGARTNPCTVGNIPDTATYLYTCKITQNGTSFVCLDPQGGPRSGTTGRSGPDFAVRLLDLIDRSVALISQLFGHSLRPGAPGPMPPPERVKTSAVSLPTQAEVYCDSGVTHVIVPNGSPDDPIVASVNQQILWGTSGEGLTITPGASTCSQFSTPAKDQAQCTVGQSPSSYTATVQGCTNAPETIVLPPPQ
jgi:hypothetical protein